MKTIRKIGFIIVLLTLTVSVIQAQESRSVFPVTDYGANGNGVAENAVSIQKAIDAAAAAGGGVVLFPRGEYRTATIFLKDNVTLRLAKGATIKGTSNYSLYPADIEPVYETFLLRKDRYAPRVLIVALDKDNVAIEGEGTIDGNGEYPDLKKKKRMDSINLIRFIKCRNVRVEGTGSLECKLLITNAAHWALQPIGVEGLIVRNVHIHNYGGETPDGLPICDSSNVLVEDCRVESDDDAMTLKSGTPEIVIENITVKNSTFISRVCGFKIGPQTFGAFKNIHITGCHFEGATKPPGTKYDPHQGVFINIGNGGSIDGVLVEDCTMTHMPSALSVFLGRITSEYWKTYWPGKPEATELGTIKNITFRNIAARDMGTFGIMLEGRSESRLQNLRFENLSIESLGGGVIQDPAPERPGAYPNLIYLYKGNISTWGMFMRHVDGVRFKDVNLWTETEDRRPDVYTEDVQNFDKGNYVLQIRPPAVTQQKTALRQWKPDASSDFEVGTQIRAWTIKDEGMDTILDTMQQLCGINNLYMVVVMHAEHRPFQAPEFPHNPARDTWQAEDSRVTFFPDWDCYGTVKPLLSDVDWIRETDWLQLMVDACWARGLAVGAEVSHYPIPKSLIKSHPDWQQRKIDGSSWSTSRFCPNNPEVREYVVALFGDLAANYDLDYIQTCQHLFDRNNTISKKGTCFCRHCIAEAAKTGFDLEAAIPKLQANENSQPEKDNWLKFRRHSTTEFYRLISAEIKKVRQNPQCHLRYNDTYPYRGWVLEDVGMHLDDVSQHLGSLVHQDHEEQKGNPNETFGRRKAWLAKNRGLIGPDMPLICGIAPRIKATPELVKAGIKVALEHPARVNGLCLKHYDGASFGLMRAFKQGMIEAGVSGLTPIIGKEVEAMELTNFTRIDDYIEEWGVETTGKGTAFYRFDNPSGIYDIRISYFDEADGQSLMQLWVADEEKICFRLNEDVGCWRWRLFKDIQVNQGDQIKLIAEADQGERPRLDFVEFIPKIVRSIVNISSVTELREVMTKSDQQIVMAPGTYVVSDLLDSRTVFLLSGSDNVLDLSGVTLQIPLSTLRKMTSRGAHGRAAYRITGHRITLKGGTFENTYDDGLTTVTDFGGYNQNSKYHPVGGMNEMTISGDDVQLIGCSLTVRGSFPYGYGNIYGIGRGNVVGLKKHGGIHSTGDRLIIDSCRVKMESFCHAIFFSGGDDITVRNTTVEGGVRPSNDLYDETNDGDLAKRFDYKMQWPESVRGLLIPRDHMLNLSEDGIRAYPGTGHVTVDNCKVMKSRGGIKLYMAKGATVSNCQVLDCVIQGYSLPSRGTMTHCSGNAAYGPLLYIHFDSHTSQHIDLKVLPSPHGLGDHPLAAINGSGHSIHFTAADRSTPEILRPIIVGYPLRFDFLCVDYPDVPNGYEARFAKYAKKSYKTSNITLTNGTAHPVVLGEYSRDNKITSHGPVKDYGTNNTQELK